MSEEKKEFWQLGEHYQVETMLFGFMGELVGLSDSELVFRPFRLDRNPHFRYHGTEEKGIFKSETAISRAQVVRASLYEF